MVKLWEKADTIRSLLRTPDGIDTDKYFVATYYIETTSNDARALTCALF